MSMSSPETLFCDDCGNETHDDTSTVFEAIGTWQETRVCFDCAPPDEDD